MSEEQTTRGPAMKEPGAGHNRALQDAQRRIRQLEQKLAAAESTIEALVAGEVDAVVDFERQKPLLLHQAQQALRESEQKFHAIFEGAGDALVIVDDDARLVDANPAASDLFQQENEELAGLSIAALGREPSRFDAVWQQLQQEGDVRGEGRLQLRDGQSCHVEYSAVAHIMPGRHLFMMRDVSARKAVEQEREEALYELRERIKELTLLHQAGHLLSLRRQPLPKLLQLLVDLIPPAWQYPSITSARVVCGPLDVQTAGFAPSPWSQRATFDVGGIGGLIEVVYSEERPQADDGPFLDEERRTLDALASMVRAEFERRRAEERRAQLAAIVEQSEDAIVGIDPDGAITSWNRGAEKMYGYSAEEAIGRPVSFVAPPERKQEMAAFAALARTASGDPQTFTTVRQHKDGRRLLVSLSVSPIRDASGRLTGFSGIVRDITEQKRAEARLRFQAQLLNSVRESVVAMDLEGRVVYWGKGATELFGFTAGEAVGRPVSELIIQAEEVERGESLLQQMLQSGAWSGELRLRRKDGTAFWGHSTVSLVRNRHGRPAGLVGIARDVTAQRQHEQELEAIAAVADALRAAESREEIEAVLLNQLLSILEAGTGAIALYDASDGALRLEHVLGRHTEIQGAVMEAGRSFTAKVVHSGRRFVTDDLGQEGSAFPQRFRGVAGACLPLSTRDKTIGALWLMREQPFSEFELRLLSAAADMAATAIQRALLFEQLEAQALQVRTIMDSVTDGLMLLDPAQNIVLANPAAQTYLELLNGPNAGERQRLTRVGEIPLEQILSLPPGYAASLVVEEPAHRDLEVAAHPVVRNGQADGWVFVVRDVTEARRRQEVNQQQERLAAVGQLAAGIAHDFNNVMSSIVLYAQILQRRADLSDKERRRLNVIYAQANHAIELIRQILDFSRRSVMERGQLDMVPFLEELFKLWERTLPENISLHMEHDGSECIVLADPTRLQQAMTNLAINARDAISDVGSLTVSLSRLQLEPDAPPPSPAMGPGVWVRIAVSDSGEGMSAETRARIFEPFFTTKGPGDGSGLGLAQVYGIVRQHEGYITVDSEPGQGATFTIYLPALNDAPQVQEAVPLDIDHAPKAAVEATVLVVEDEDVARFAVEETLRTLGYHVLSANDGLQALKVCEQEQVDLVLSDLVMPEMGGLKLFEALHERYPGARMIIMSGYPLEDEGRTLLEEGVVDWLQKPFSVTDLAAKVSEALAR
ncbi:MAG TPA: PAS domain S-box protein [Candidatus Sulfomarinibacteraceae bacterium]|nr:PAS domain S-box protein [Candidatus Sulfomarinibacteraceae bacterium]